MSCSKNAIRFLFWKFPGPHSEEIIRVGKFMVGSSDSFMVRFKCRNCGAERTLHFVPWDELLRYGMSNEEIERASRRQF